MHKENAEQQQRLNQVRDPSVGTPCVTGHMAIELALILSKECSLNTERATAKGLDPEFGDQR